TELKIRLEGLEQFGDRDAFRLRGHERLGAPANGGHFLELLLELGLGGVEVRRARSLSVFVTSMPVGEVPAVTPVDLNQPPRKPALDRHSPASLVVGHHRALRWRFK